MKTTIHFFVLLIVLVGCTIYCDECGSEVNSPRAESPKIELKYKVLLPKEGYGIQGDSIVLFNAKTLKVSPQSFCTYFKIEVSSAKIPYWDYDKECEIKNNELFVKIYITERNLTNLKENEKLTLKYYAYNLEGNAFIIEGDRVIQMNSLLQSPEFIFIKDSLRFRKPYWQNLAIDLMEMTSVSSPTEQQLLPVSFSLGLNLKYIADSEGYADTVASIGKGGGIYPDSLLDYFDVCTGEKIQEIESGSSFRFLKYRILSMASKELNPYGGWEVDTISVMMKTEYRQDTLIVFVENYWDKSCKRY